MKQGEYKRHIEILPAALLSQRRTWQGVANGLPAGACLLISNPNDTEQTKLMQTLARSFREKGRQVVVWTVGQRGVEWNQSQGKKIIKNKRKNRGKLGTAQGRRLCMKFNNPLNIFLIERMGSTKFINAGLI